MGKTFVCSLCRNGIIGGGLYIDEQSITYSTLTKVHRAVCGEGNALLRKCNNPL